MGSSARDQIPGLQYASCEGDALLFTAGEGHDLVSRDMAESEPGEHGLGLALPDLFAVTVKRMPRVTLSRALMSW